jgi:hypothetical protein
LKLAFSLAELGGVTMIFVSKGKPVADLLEENIPIKFKLRLIIGKSPFLRIDIEILN